MLSVETSIDTHCSDVWRRFLTGTRLSIGLRAFLRSFDYLLLIKSGLIIVK